jgi:protein-tyrosine phosphatase
VIDLHSHILPGLDDGAPDVEVSVAMARAAVSEGTRTMVGTPHVNLDYPVEPAAVPALAEALAGVLRKRGVALTVLPGAEVALSRLPELDDEAMAASCLADGPYLLVESPYSQAVPFLEEQLFRLRTQGFRPLLAHPERCPVFQTDPDRLARLVRQGILCSVTAGSMEGMFGRSVRRFTAQLFGEGLVHDVASDAHDPHGRRPGLRRGFESLDEELPGIAAQADWYTTDAPGAILSGDPLPPRPEPPRRRPQRRLRLAWRR